jgi:hypothetical protein
MRWTSGLFLALALAACSAPTVSRDYDPKQDFTTLKTWAWAPDLAHPERDMEVSSLTHDRIRNAIQSELAAKNLQQVDADKASFWVRYVATRKPVAATTTSGYPSYSDGNLVVVDVGSLVIDISPPNDKRQIWRGAAYRDVDSELTPEQREAQIKEVVHQILETFPPKK